jgi:hypothetical protein
MLKEGEALENVDVIFVTRPGDNDVERSSKHRSDKDLQEVEGLSHLVDFCLGQGTDVLASGFS